MKKTLILTIVLLLAAFALAGCGNTKSGTQAGSDKQEALSTDSLKTFGDVIALDGKEDLQTAVGEGNLVYAFKYGDTYYRVSSDIPKETEKAYIDIDITKEGYEKKQQEMISSIEVDKVENLSEQILKQSDLDALAGKTGGELVKDGWTYDGSYDLESMEFWMNYGPFTYMVTFDGKVKGGNSDDFDAEKATRDRKVKTIRFESIGDATTRE